MLTLQHVQLPQESYKLLPHARMVLYIIDLFYLLKPSAPIASFLFFKEDLTT